MKGTQAVQYRHFEDGVWETVDGAVVDESLLHIHVNGLELVTLMCSPVDQDVLTIGFLRSEGIIRTLDDIRLLKVCPSGTCVDVWLRQADYSPPARFTLTSGCGGGVTFADLSAAAQPITSSLSITVEQLCGLMQEVQREGKLYRAVRGVHTGALATAEHLYAIAEDVGRHNTVDRLWGRCVIESIATQDSILLSTGRISSEMLHKAALMGVPVVASRTSPTGLSVELAQAWNITLAGYVRRDTLNVYTGQERITSGGGPTGPKRGGAEICELVRTSGWQ